MNPLLIAKLVGALVVLAALAGAVTWAAKTIEKANGYEAAIARVTEVEREKAALAKSFADAAAEDARIDETLSNFRAELGTQSQTFRELLTARPITREVPREKINGIPQPCIERDPTRYRGLFNCATLGNCAADPERLF